MKSSAIPQLYTDHEILGINLLRDANKRLVMFSVIAAGRRVYGVTLQPLDGELIGEVSLTQPEVDAARFFFTRLCVQEYFREIGGGPGHAFLSPCGARGQHFSSRQHGLSFIGLIEYFDKEMDP